MEAYLLLFLLFFLPFLVTPFGVTPFETAKVFTAEIIIDILFLILLFKKKIEVKKLLKFRYLPVFSILVISFVDLILFKKQVTFFGNQFRLQGTFLFWHLLLFSIIIGFIDKKKIYKFNTLAFLLTILSVFIFGFIDGRTSGSIGEPNAFSSYLIFLWPTIFLNYKNKIKFLVPLIIFVLIILSGSRSGVAGFVIQIIFIFLTSMWSKKLFVIDVIISILIAAAIILPFNDLTRTLENRTTIWKSAIAGANNNLLFGNGFGNVEYVIHDGANFLKNNIRYTYVDSAHNIFLDYLIEGGILGLVLILVIVIYTIYRLSRAKKIIELTMFFGLLTTLLFNPAGVVGLLGFWFLIGL